MRRLLVPLLAALSVLGAVHAADSRTPQPKVVRAKAGTQCVEPAADMRRNHMTYLKHQRDATVQGGVRGARHSLKGCIECHASPTTHSVAHAQGDFCSGCHQYAAVTIDCFECHSARPRDVAGTRLPAKDALK